MDILNIVSPVINGGITTFCCLILYRMSEVEKRIQKDKELFLNFKEREGEENQKLENRILDIEMELSKRFSTWGKKYSE